MRDAGMRDAGAMLRDAGAMAAPQEPRVADGCGCHAATRGARSFELVAWSILAGLLGLRRNGLGGTQRKS
jgi:hypothetical protein